MTIVHRGNQNDDFKVFFFLPAWEIPDFDVIPENKVICQGDRLRLHCANASMGLTIYSALYGRTEPGHVICPYREAENDYNYNCGEVDVTEMFKTMCEKKSRCKIKVNSALFGDPCPGKHLYLNLVYACGEYVFLFKFSVERFEHITCMTRKRFEITIIKTTII